jgi:hypothetical protein
MFRRYRRRHGILVGTIVGGIIGAIAALVITLIGPGQAIWWTPAGFVVGVFAGLMVGFMLAEDVKGGAEDELATAEAEAALHAQSEQKAATREQS